MPLFEYTCRQCGQEFEELVLKDGQKIPCPSCSSTKTEKLLSKCSFKSGGSSSGPDFGSSSASGSSCSGCSGGSCSTCG